MTRTKIAIYLVLIFIAGAVAGGALVLSSPQTFAPEHRPRRHGDPEEFANHLWNKMKERLELDEVQAQKIEPIFRSGFAAVRTIQEKSLEQVEAAVRRNHEEISQHLNEKQKAVLQEMNTERQNFLKQHRGHGGPPPPDGKRPEKRPMP